MADPRDFLLNTDYEMDKIIYFTQGSLNAGQYDVSIPHKLGFAPLIFGVCAFNSDFTDSRTIPYNYSTMNNTVQFTAYSSNSDIKMSYINYDGNPNTIYYRIYAFEPSDSSAKIGTTSSKAKQFILNTDYNYCKLFKKGILNGNSTVSHNLGYIPQVLAWHEENGLIYPVEESTPNDPMTNLPQHIDIDKNTIKTYGYNKVHYRIYYDEE